MDLKEFIQETLIQVAQASKNASEQMQRENLGEGVQDNNSIKISFDVAVTVSQETNSEIKGGLRVLNALNIGGEQGETFKSENVSRIKLELPLKIVGGKTQAY